jgi:hypothetical protein
MCGSLPIAEHSSGLEEEERSIAAVEIRNSYAPALIVRIGKGSVAYCSFVPVPKQGALLSWIWLS